MRVAICDDELKDLQELQTAIKQYGCLHGSLQQLNAKGQSLKESKAMQVVGRRLEILQLGSSCQSL